ncbi:hypothetical protein ACLKA6_013521 [Drosophila palustris]
MGTPAVKYHRRPPCRRLQRITGVFFYSFRIGKQAVRFFPNLCHRPAITPPRILTSAYRYIQRGWSVRKIGVRASERLVASREQIRQHHQQRDCAASSWQHSQGRRVRQPHLRLHNGGPNKLVIHV